MKDHQLGFLQKLPDEGDETRRYPFGIPKRVLRKAACRQWGWLSYKDSLRKAAFEKFESQDFSYLAPEEKKEEPKGDIKAGDVIRSSYWGTITVLGQIPDSTVFLCHCGDPTNSRNPSGNRHFFKHHLEDLRDGKRQA